MVEGIGVEKTFPLFSPLITKIEITKTPKVRRAKLFYMRGLAGKATRLRTQVGLAAKDEKFGKKKHALLEGMGHDASAEAPISNAQQSEMLMDAPAPAAETPAPEAKKE